MSFLLLENRLSIDTLVVPGYFIDRFLPAASGTDVKVYLYLLRAVSTSATGLSSASISDRLDISEREVLRSLSYWESVGLMRLSLHRVTNCQELHLQIHLFRQRQRLLHRLHLHRQLHLLQAYNL